MCKLQLPTCLLCGSTGWITHWGEPMANTSAAVMTRSLENILSYANDTGEAPADKLPPWPHMLQAQVCRGKYSC